MEHSKQPNVKILVACHKADPNIRQDDVYMPIQVGKALHPELDLGFQSDNTGDNISEKNGSYCELTALYWAWKNLKDVDYIGLCHYRRYFDLNISDVTRLLSKVDCIILTKRKMPISIVKELASLTSWEDTYIFIDELISLCPQYKSQIFDYFYKNNKFTNCNMFIMDRKRFDSYCEFLFTLLSRVESRILMHGYSRLNRVLGYLSEPLLGFWLDLNNYSFIEVDKDQSLELGGKRSFLGRIGDSVRTNGAFWLTNFSLHKTEPKFFEDWVINGLRLDGVELKNL